MTETMDQTLAQAQPNGQNGQPLSLPTEAARNLATTTKTPPQMQGITERWLLKVLPWVQVNGGVYRVNRRLTYAIGDGRVTFITNGDTDIHVVPQELRELNPLREFEDEATLSALADRFVTQRVAAGDVLAQEGQPADQVVLVAHGRLNQTTTSKYDGEVELDVLADGEFYGADQLVEDGGTWPFTVKAASSGIVLVLSRADFDEVADQSDALSTYLEQVRAHPRPAHNRHGEADIALMSGHIGEPDVGGTFVDYERAPREYPLSVAQTVLRVHSRVADLYNDPMNQTEQQLKLTIEGLRERQEHEMINNPEFGLLHNADFKERIRTRNGPPTPDDLDELMSRRTKPQYFFAHPRAIAAFGRECTRRGLYPQTVPMGDRQVPAWRGLPIFPCSKIPVDATNRTTSIICVRTGEADRGVVGLHHAGIPDEYEPSLSVRFMGINEKAIISYLVTAYYSVAVLVPDALGVLEDVEVGHFND